MFNELTGLSAKQNSHFLSRFILQTWFFFCLVTQICFGQEDYTVFSSKPWEHNHTNSSNFENRYGDKNLYKLRMGDQEIPIKTYSGQIPKEQQIETVKSVLTEDFLVNDDAGAGTVGTNSPSVAMDLAGNFIIVWEDRRNGNSDVYYQHFNSDATTQGTNTKVNDDAGIAGQYSPSIAMDVTGNFIVVWEDERNGNSDIYYQRYNSAGTTLGTNTKVNDDTGSEGQGSPSIAMDGTGNFVIVWKDSRDIISDIYFQRYNSDGTTLGTNTKVNVTNDAHSPSIAMDGGGNFTIVWAGFYNYHLDIYYQRYNSSGAKLGVTTRVNDDGGYAYQDSPSIVIDGNGNFVIVWEDQRNINSGNEADIYYQRYNNFGTPLGLNTKANDNASRTTVYSTPSVAIDGAGNFAITWRDVRNNNSDIYYQRFNSSGIAQGVNTMVNDDNETKFQWYPSIAVNGAGNFTIVWMDERDDNSDVYYQRYNSSGTSLGVNIKANDDAGAAGQLYPSIAMDSTGNFVIVWQDERNGDLTPDIYYQHYNGSGTTLGINKKVNEAVGGYQHSPSIAMDVKGNFVIVWEDQRNINSGNEADIYYQRYNGSGTTLGINKKVNEAVGGYQHSPSIAMDVKGNFVIAWTGNNIYFQLYNSNGETQGVNSKANDDTVCFMCRNWYSNPSIAMDGSGNFLIVWNDWRNGNSDIYYQQYNSSGEAQGVNTKVNDDAGSEEGQGSTSIAMDGSGNFLIVWNDWRNGNSDIYYQQYNSSGEAQGVNTKVNHDNGNAGQCSPSIAMDVAGNFAILWEDYRYGATNPDIIGQRYFANGNPNGNNYRIVANGPNFGEIAPVLAANNTKIFFSWMDNRRSKGWDIYAKIFGWDWDGIVPVELTSFTAIANGKEVSLSWSTATELNNQGFEVQRKFGSNNFVTIGSVRGHGTTTSPNSYTYVDKLLTSGKYFYRLKQIDYGGKYEYSKVVEVNWSPFTTYKLEQNYPNPFNPTTTIGFGIREKGNVRLSVLNILGEEITVLLNEEKEAGYHSVDFSAGGGSAYGGNASSLPSGVYFYQLRAGSFVETKKMILLR